MKIALHTLPDEPGIYRFFDRKKQIIYIGKAKSLRTRVRSYFHAAAEHSAAKSQMITEIADLDYIVVNNETEALLLEAGLIKKHQPAYNIVLRDDKSWTYIVVTDEAFPRIMTVRGRKKMRGKKYGPYTSAASAKIIVRLLHQILPLRTCKRDLSRLPNGLVCMQFHLGQCLGPCELRTGRAEYDVLIQQAEDILKGRGGHVYRELKRRMSQSAAREEFEQAAVLRDKIAAWERVFRPQHVEHARLTSMDAISQLTADGSTYVTVLQVRKGQIADKLNYILRNPLHAAPDETLEQFLLQYYGPPNLKPAEIALPAKISGSAARALAPSRILIPQRGSRKKILALAHKNAQLNYERSRRVPRIAPELYELQQALGMASPPQRIECYDISNVSGRYAVGAMVVMENGRLKPSAYRKFRIKTVRGPNDVMMMREVLMRRQSHTEWPEPNLIVVDGGKPQLSAARAVLNDPWKNRAIALAKQHEEIFVAGKSRGIRLNRTSRALICLQKIRDAAHRQAITYYRLLHKKEWKT